MSAGVSGLSSEEGLIWLRVSPGHAISEQWLEERAPDLYVRWWDAPSLHARDEMARSIEKRLEELEAAESWEKLALRHQAEAPRTTLAERVARHEAEAGQLGATPFDDPRRTAAQLSHQASGDALRAELTAEAEDPRAVHPDLAPTLIAQPEWLSESGWRARDEPVRAAVDSDFGFGWGPAERTRVSFMPASRDLGRATTDPGTRGMLYLYDASSLRYAVVARNVTYAGVLAAEAEHTGYVRGQDPVEFAHRVVHHTIQRSVAAPVEAGPAAELGRADRALLLRRLDAADLVADRPFIEAMSGVSVDRLAVAALSAAAENQRVVVAVERVRAEMASEDPHAALRADVLLAVAAAGHVSAELRAAAAGRGVDLAEVAPALLPASDFYARHAPAIEARLDREIARSGFADLPSYVVSWPWGRPASASLHDTEQAIVEHIIGGEIAGADGDGRDLRDAQRLWQRAVDRAALREWSGALDRGEVELAAPRAAAAGQQLDLGLHVDDEVDAGHNADQEVG
jgi:hypothetical protein